MSKTWKHANSSSPAVSSDRTPQAAIDRMRKAEAQQDIREALTAPQEAEHVK